MVDEGADTVGAAGAEHDDVGPGARPARHAADDEGGVARVAGAVGRDERVSILADRPAGVHPDPETPAGTVSRLAGDEPPLRLLPCRHEASRGCPPFAHRRRQRLSLRRSYPPSTAVAFDGLGLIFANRSTATILALAKSEGVWAKEVACRDGRVWSL